MLQIAGEVSKAMGSNLTPDIRNEANNEIRKQFLSADKARVMLNWRPLFTLNEGLNATVKLFHDMEKTQTDLLKQVQAERQRH